MSSFRPFVGLVPILVALAPVARAGESRTEAELAAIEARRQWEVRFDEGIVDLTALPGGFVRVETRDVPPLNKKKAGPEHTHLVDGATGKTLWSGPSEGNQVVATGGLALRVSQEPGSLAVQAYEPSGATAWTRSIPGTAITSTTDPGAVEVLALVADGAWYDGSGTTAVRLLALDARTGADKWTAPLGDLTLPPWVDTRALALAPGTAWVAAGGEVFGVRRTDGSIVARAQAPDTADGETPAMLGWAITDDLAALSVNGDTLLVDASGVRWTASFDRRNVVVDDVALVPGAVVVGYRAPKRMAFARYDLTTGAETWREDLHEGWWSRGMAVTPTTLVFARKGRVVGLDLQTGETRFEHSVLGSKAQDAGILAWHADGERVVAEGLYDVVGIDTASGALAWEAEQVQRPITVYRDKTKLAAAVAQAGYQFSATLDQMMAQGMRELAKAGGCASVTCEPGEYLMSPTARYQLEAAAQGAERSAMWSSASAALIDALQLGTGDGITAAGLPAEIPATATPVVGPRQVLAWDVLDRKQLMGFCEAIDLVVLDTRDGSRAAVPIAPSDKPACIPLVAADTLAGRLYQTGRQVAVGCDEKHVLRAFSTGL